VSLGLEGAGFLVPVFFEPDDPPDDFLDPEDEPESLTGILLFSLISSDEPEKCCWMLLLSLSADVRRIVRGVRR
jgi:hypothetical protein